jgi:RNA polymerase sigma-70 factor (ECF subfamily)
MSRTIRLDLGTEAPIGELNSRNRRTVLESALDETSKAQSHVGRIRAPLDTVGVRTREIYIAHRAGHSYAEIAEHLNISQNAIKRHIARALLAIMEHGDL